MPDVPIAGARDLPSPTGFVALVEPDTRQDVKDAYELCYREESRLVQRLEELRQVSGPRREQIEASIVRIRVIGWMFVFIVDSQTLVKLATAVSSCRLEDDGYDTLGQYFLDHWIKTFRPTGKSRETTQSSTESTENQAGEAPATPSTPTNYMEAKKRAFVRDGYRCVITGSIDFKSWAKEDVRAMADSLKAVAEPTRCAHIFSWSINPGIEDSPNQMLAANAWAVLSCFGFNDIFAELNGKRLHRLENVMTLATRCHELFDSLHLWFEPADPDDSDSHEYKIKARDDYRAYLPYLPFTATFVNHATENPEHYPLPSKKYLMMHATCCKVAHLSGAAEYLDKLAQDKEELGVLENDGSSSEVLADAVWEAFRSQGVREA